MADISEPVKTDGQVVQRLRGLTHYFEPAASKSLRFLEHRRCRREVTGLTTDDPKSLKADEKIAQRLRDLTHYFKQAATQTMGFIERFGGVAKVTRLMADISKPLQSNGQVAELFRRLTHRFKQAATQGEGFFERRRRSREVTRFALDLPELAKTDGQVAQRLWQFTVPVEDKFPTANCFIKVRLGRGSIAVSPFRLSYPHQRLRQQASRGWCVPQDAQRPVGRLYRLLCPVPRQKSLDRPQEYTRMRARVVLHLAFDSARFRQCEINVKGGIGEDIRYGGFPFHRAPPTGIP